MIAGLALLLAAATPLPPALTVHSERFFHGEAQALAAASDDLHMRFPVRSLRTSGGWQVCSEPRLKGDCVELEGDYPVEAGLGMRFSIRSLRPIPPGSGAGASAPTMAPGGASLAGLTSRYWPAPTYGSERVLACPTGEPSRNCAHDTAEDLCRRAGYRQAEHFQLEDVGGRLMLSDVLCVKGAWGVTR